MIKRSAQELRRVLLHCSESAISECRLVSSIKQGYGNP
jgi:hypothetical protein